MSRSIAWTSDEILATLKRSTLNTVLVEGEDDILLYRKMEEELSHLNIDFMPCGGKSNLLEVYKRRDELSGQVLFICDSDLWIFIGQPSYLNDAIITTEGYSLENELFQDGSDIILKLLDKNETERYNKIIESICKWYTFEIEKVLRDESYDCGFSDVKIKNTQIIAENADELSKTFLVEKGFSGYDKELFNKIYNKYEYYLRGKFIFQAFGKIFEKRPSESGRYKQEHLFDMIYRFTIATNDQQSILVRRKQTIKKYFAN